MTNPLELKPKHVQAFVGAWDKMYKEWTEDNLRSVKMDTVSNELWPETLIYYGCTYQKKYIENPFGDGAEYVYNRPKGEIMMRGQIDGIGKDAPTIQNERGASHSKSKYRFDLLDPQTMFDIARVLHEGAEKYGDTNWHDISIEDHMNHAMQHVFAFMANDYQDEHLIHAICRLMFAKFLEERD